MKINGLPNSVREKLLQQGSGRTAIVLDVLLSLEISGRYISVREAEERIAAAGLNVATRLVRAGLDGDLLHAVPEPAEGKGRPAMLYWIPVRADLIRRFADGFEGETDCLLPEDVQTLSKYRAGLHREFIRRSPGQYGRGWLSQRLGLSKNATREYEKSDEWEVTSRFKFEYVNDFLAIPERAIRGATWLVASVLDLVAEDAIWRFKDRATIPGVHLPFCRFVAYQQKRVGRFVFKVTQQCNHYAFNETKWAVSKGPYAWAYSNA